VWPLALDCDLKAGKGDFVRYLHAQDRDDANEGKHAGAGAVFGSSLESDDSDLGQLLSFGAARRRSIHDDLSRMSELEALVQTGSSASAVTPGFGGVGGIPAGPSLFRPAATTAAAFAKDRKKNTKNAIESVLVAFCAARPDVSYVQGMSYLALVLVSHMDRERAFHCLCNLLDCDYFHAYLDMDVQQVRLRFQIFDELFRHNLRTLHSRFEAMGLLPDCYLMEWMMCLHSKQLHIKAASRVWDGYLIHGEMYVFRVSIAILSLLQPVLLKKPLNACMKILRSKFHTIQEGALVDSARLVRIPATIANFVAAVASHIPTSAPASPDLGPK